MILAGLVLSHWFLDLFTHRPDLLLPVKGRRGHACRQAQRSSGRSPADRLCAQALLRPAPDYGRVTLDVAAVLLSPESP